MLAVGSAHTKLDLVELAPMRSKLIRRLSPISINFLYPNFLFVLCLVFIRFNLATYTKKYFFCVNLNFDG